MPTYRYESASPLLSLREASQLGYGGYSTLRKRIADGHLPAQRLGNRIRVRRDDLDALLNNDNPVAVDAVITRIIHAAPRLTAEQTRRLRDLLGEA